MAVCRSKMKGIRYKFCYITNVGNITELLTECRNLNVGENVEKRSQLFQNLSQSQSKKKSSWTCLKQCNTNKNIQ